MDIQATHGILATSNKTDIRTYTDKERMDKAATEFEEFFVYQMLEQTQPEVDVNSEFSGGEMEQAFRPVLNQYLAKEIVEAGGVGLKENIVNQMKKYQEVENNGR